VRLFEAPARRLRLKEAIWASSFRSFSRSSEASGEIMGNMGYLTYPSASAISHEQIACVGEPAPSANMPRRYRDGTGGVGRKLRSKSII
jgi:hypothetical protein